MPAIGGHEPRGRSEAISPQSILETAARSHAIAALSMISSDQNFVGRLVLSDGESQMHTLYLGRVSSNTTQK